VWPSSATLDGAVEVGDRGQQRAQQPDLGVDELGEGLGVQAARWGGCGPEALEELGWAAAAAVGVPAAEGGQAGLAEPGGGLWGGVGLEEG
jgi:hypothetical protein